MTTNAKVLTKELSKKLLAEEHLMHKTERTWAGHILRLADYRKEHYDTMEFFQWLRNRRLKFHKKVAVFAMRMFRELGAQYRLFKIKKKFLP